jgi:23S rRNA pseudouridine1911/1915/1917 synthase
MRSRKRKDPQGQRDMSQPLHEWRFEVGSPDHGCRLDSFLSARLSWRSRQRIKRVIDGESVEIVAFKDKHEAPVGRVRSSLRLRLGQEVIVRLPAPQTESDEGMLPPERAEVVLEDEHLVVIDKPPNRNVYPSRRHRTNSLIEWVHSRHRQRHGSEGYFPTPCHRLDRETSGLVLFAKSRKVRAELSQKFEDRAVRKLYLALVEGRPAGDAGVIDGSLGVAELSKVEMKVGVCEDGLHAQTHWRLVRAFGDFSLLELEPRTGRRHQLRAHLASLGHPIIGDKLYGGGDDLFLRSLSGELPDRDQQRLRIDRQALHAYRLEFRLDHLASDLCLEAPLAPDIALWMEDHAVSEVSSARLALGA